MAVEVVVQATYCPEGNLLVLASKGNGHASNITMPPIVLPDDVRPTAKSKGIQRSYVDASSKCARARNGCSLDRDVTASQNIFGRRSSGTSAYANGSMVNVARPCDSERTSVE